MLKKKIWANFQRIIEFFAQKIVTKLSKVWVWDPGSGKNLFRIPDPGVKKAPDPGSATLHNFTLSKHIDTVDDSKAASEGPVPQPIMLDLDLTCLKKKKATSKILVIRI